MADSSQLSRNCGATAVRTFRRIHLTVEAMRYTDETRDAVIAWLGNACQHTAVDEDGCGYDLANLRIHVPNGTLRADKGDWIVKDTDGGFYPCPARAFEQIYGPDDGAALAFAPEELKALKYLAGLGLSELAREETAAEESAIEKLWRAAS
jgi:hypothetical protein